jgi:hypothetical protein
MLILDRPNFPPYVCITCGVGTGRKWFVSLDFPLDNYFNPVNDGIIFQCNECWESLATTVAKQAQLYLIGTEPWVNEGFVEPTYDNETEVVEEVTFGGSISPVPESHSLTSGDNKPDDSGNTEPSTSNQPTDTTTTDDDDEPVSEFRAFFESGG